MKMKKNIILCLLVLGFAATASFATSATDSIPTRVVQKKGEKADIQFDKLRADVGTFPAKDPIRKCQFKFKNTGQVPLIINQVFASCGCTVPTYPKEPIQPGKSGVIEITYNGTNKFPGHFMKTVTVRSNAKREIIRLTVEGTMTE